jgi:hypothetical protein
MVIHTPTTLQASRRRITRRLETAQFVLAKMRRGEALHLTFTQYGPRWSLSGGRRIDSDVAAIVVKSASVIDVGDALFAGSTAQTFRWWREES